MEETHGLCCALQPRLWREKQAFPSLQQQLPNLWSCLSAAALRGSVIFLQKPVNGRLAWSSLMSWMQWVRRPCLLSSQFLHKA